MSVKRRPQQEAVRGAGRCSWPGAQGTRRTGPAFWVALWPVKQQENGQPGQALSL